MAWKRSALNQFVKLAAGFSSPPGTETVQSLFVLRNNDIGDLLVVTPLFEALRRTFPQARLVAGVGRWNLPVLDNNPYLDAVLEVNAPWHNKFTRPNNLLSIVRYLLTSQELTVVRDQRFDLGLDVLGSPWGALFLLRSRIGRRVAMRGYAGGEPGAQQHVPYNPGEHVGRNSLRFAELLGAQSLPPCRPQIFLRSAEMDAAEKIWKSNQAFINRKSRASVTERPRLLLAPGAGFPSKGWPEGSWAEVLRTLDRKQTWNMILVGSEEDVGKCTRLAAGSSSIANLAGQITLRQTFALAATTDRVICHSSMLWHAAAAWKKPSLVVLGECFPSAREHHRQWGYPESVVLGRESTGRDSATVLEVLAGLSAEPPRSAEVKAA